MQDTPRLSDRISCVTCRSVVHVILELDFSTQQNIMHFPVYLRMTGRNARDKLVPWSPINRCELCWWFTRICILFPSLALGCKLFLLYLFGFKKWNKEHQRGERFSPEVTVSSQNDLDAFCCVHPVQRMWFAVNVPPSANERKIA